jgi:hypothetical protein
MKIAVIDSGVHAAHPHVNGVAGGVAFTAEGLEDSDYTDRLGHGTAVTAVIREQAPAADIFAIKIFHDRLATRIQPLIAALDWCARNRVQVANLSLGTNNPSHEPALRAAVGRLHDAGVKLVSAHEWLPGTIDGVLPVALDWDCPRGEYRTSTLSDGRTLYHASGYPRPVPGVPPERNLKGVSFAVANVTGLLAKLLCLILIAVCAHAQRFVILGDRTGEAQPGVYEAALREIAKQKPEFIISVGDSIQGLDDSKAASEWRDWHKLVEPYRRIPLYLAAGNHDVWSELSEKLYQQESGRPLHYSFDRGPVHVTILDNSRSDAMPPSEMTFLEEDLRAPSAATLKVIVSHRPSWVVDAALGNTSAPLHQLAKRYGVKYVIAGHVHQLIHASLDGVEYVSVASSGGHLRLSKKYEDGWFFGYSLIDGTTFKIHELSPPHGEGRVTSLEEWGTTGLRQRNTAVQPARVRLNLIRKSS